MFMYLEDDTDVPWPALHSWAVDTEARSHQGHALHMPGLPVSAPENFPCETAARCCFIMQQP